MEKRCVFRVEVEGRLLRLEISDDPKFNGFYGYRVLHKRKVLARGIVATINSAVQVALEIAFGCKISIEWREKL